MTKKLLSRRDFVKAATLGGGAIGLAACAAPAVPATPAAAAAAPKATAVPVVATKSVEAVATPMVATAVPTDAPLQPGFQRPTDGPAKRGGILKIGLPINPQHFDPHQGSITYVLVNIYSHLMTREMSTGASVIVPDLAERFEVSSDSLSYTFYLRSGVKWHDGTDFTSADVVATFERIMSPPEGVVPPRKDIVNSAVEKVEALDPMTVRFTLKQPVPWFLEIIILDDMLIVSKKALDENKGDLKKVNAPGTGPYMHKEAIPKEKWELVKNPNYWDAELPYLDGILFIHAQEMVERGMAVLADQADMTFNTTTPVRVWGSKREDITARLIAGGYQGMTMFINNSRKPFDDVRVRRAIQLGVNRQSIVKAFESQQPVDISRWVSVASAAYAMSTEEVQKLPGYRPNKDEDIAEAKKLMAEAGFANGFGPKEVLTANTPQFADILTPAFVDQLKTNLGIELKIRVVDRSLLIEESKKGNFDLLVGNAYEVPFADPTSGWDSQFRTGGATNYARYSNAEFDELLDQLFIEMDYAKRKELVNKGCDMLDANPPIIYIGPGNNSPIWKNYVKGHGIEKQILSVWGRMATTWLDK